MLAGEVRHIDSDAPVEKLPFGSRVHTLTEYVYVIRYYTVHGVDIAIWERDAAGNYRRFVYATGPMSLTPPPLPAPTEPEDPSLSRADRIWKRLNRPDYVEALLARWSQIYEEEGPRAESDVAISADEFRTAMALAQQFRPGCTVITDIGIRIIAQSAESVLDYDTTGGTGDFEVVFRAAKELFRQAGIEELEWREFSM